MDTPRQNAATSALDEEPRPAPPLAGLFVGFASVSLTFGTFWPFAVLFPAIVAALAAVLPVNGHRQFAKGAFHAFLGVAAFEIVFTTTLLLT